MGPAGNWQPAGGGSREMPGVGGTLAMAIVGLFCCGIILGPIATFKARGMMQQMDATPGVIYTNRGTVQAAFVIGIIATVLSILGIIYFATAS
jgi:uncharacterized membrane protein YqaE (UPF0057 family)